MAYLLAACSMAIRNIHAMKDIKDYLHLYLGCEVDTNVKGQYVHPYGAISIKILTPASFEDILYTLNRREKDQQDGYIDSNHIYCKLILRPLSDMTEDECIEIYQKIYPSVDIARERMINVIRNQCSYKGIQWEGSVSIFDYTEWFPILLHKGFDLFGLIDAGLAIDVTKFKSK